MIGGAAVMPRISEAEHTRRQRMMDSVLGTHEMEGMFADEATLAIIKKYVTGELDMDGFSAAMDAHARSQIPVRSTLVAVA
jgi:hypothetical protein